MAQVIVQLVFCLFCGKDCGSMMSILICCLALVLILLWSLFWVNAGKAAASGNNHSSVIYSGNMF